MDVRKAARKMNFMMGAAMSISLSLIGMLSAGKFSLPGFFLNVLISFVISYLIGAILPIRQISSGILDKLNLKPGSLIGRIIDALTSDIIYTPIMTTIMIALAYRQAKAQGAKISFLPMWFKSLLISMAAAFVLIFLITPFFMKIAFKGVNRKDK